MFRNIGLNKRVKEQKLHYVMRADRARRGSGRPLRARLGLARISINSHIKNDRVAVLM